MDNADFYEFDIEIKIRVREFVLKAYARNPGGNMISEFRENVRKTSVIALEDALGKATRTKPPSANLKLIT